MAQLAVKVVLLTIKTASKPLANSFQGFVLGHPAFRQKAIDGAQLVNFWNARLTRAVSEEASEGKVFVGKLSDEKALRLASKFLSESFLYAVGGGLIFYEYSRSNKKDLEKKRSKEERRREKELKQMRMNVHQMEIIGEIVQRLERLEEQHQQPSPSRWPWQNMKKKKKTVEAVTVEETQQQRQQSTPVELDL